MDTRGPVFGFSLKLVFDRYRRRRLRARTERLLSELPLSVLKDIGWPDRQRWDDGPTY